MSSSFPFEPDFTWRKLGYNYFTNSLSYREVLEQNPQWSVTELPPVGAQISITSASTAETSGGLSQGSFIFGGSTDSGRENFFPFDSESEYMESLYRYTTQGVVDRNSLNGITFDSVQAITGNQSG